jgi:hypothetical protein
MTEGVTIPGNILFIPQRKDIKWDIMIGSNWKGQVTLPLQVGVEYSQEELKAFVRLQRPSLRGKEFDVLPSNSRVFRR